MLPYDYSNDETTSAEPEASSMIEIFGAIAYSIEAAVVDITACSHKVSLDNFQKDRTC
jgi:hypothetical protein